MNQGGKVAVIFGAVVLVLAIGVGFLGRGSDPASNKMAVDETSVPQVQETPVAPNDVAIPVVPATGNPDEIVATLFADADADMALFADTNEDLAILTSDTDAITGLGMAYDETAY